MKKTTLFALAVIVCLVGAVASSYCMAAFAVSEAVFGVLAVVFGSRFRNGIYSVCKQAHQCSRLSVLYVKTEFYNYPTLQLIWRRVG